MKLQKMIVEIIFWGKFYVTHQIKCIDTLFIHYNSVRKFVPSVN